MRPKLLDLFCGAGGIAVGYHRAGFDVVGVDIKAQPRYPFRMVVGDALRPPFDLSAFDAIHASPPCQAFTNARVIHGHAHDDLLTPTREMLRASGRPWVIENVPGAPMRADAMLCGSMFGQRRLIRHRMFEFDTPRLCWQSPCEHDPKKTVRVFGHGGDVYHTKEVWAEVMGIDWMTRDELAQAIPPSYGEYIGRHLIAALHEKLQ